MVQMPGARSRILTASRRSVIPFAALVYRVGLPVVTRSGIAQLPSDSDKDRLGGATRVTEMPRSNLSKPGSVDRCTGGFQNEKNNERYNERRRNGLGNRHQAGAEQFLHHAHLL